MPTPTYTLIASTTVSSAAPSVTFNDIPNIYKDLIIITNTFSSTGSPTLGLRFNSDSGTNYQRVFMYSDGSSTPVSGVATESALNIANVSTSDLRPIVGQIIDYSSTDKYTMILSDWYASSNLVVKQIGRWVNTNVITSVQVFYDSGNITVGSVISLYGVVA
jgi:hypothetical protein